MTENTGVLTKPIDDLTYLVEVHPGVGCLHVNLEKRMTENTFSEAPSFRVGFLGEYELFWCGNRYVFGNVIRIATGDAQKARRETKENPNGAEYSGPCLFPLLLIREGRGETLHPSSQQHQRETLLDCRPKPARPGAMCW